MLADFVMIQKLTCSLLCSSGTILTKDSKAYSLSSPFSPLIQIYFGGSDAVTKKSAWPEFLCFLYCVYVNIPCVVILGFTDGSYRSLSTPVVPIPKILISGIIHGYYSVWCAHIYIYRNVNGTCIARIILKCHVFMSLVYWPC